MIVLSVVGACAYGVADFLGGVATRRAAVTRVVAITAPASLLIELALLPFFGATWTAGSLGWGALSGVASACTFILLYHALSIGPMTVIAPITAIVSAVLPVIVGLVSGERISVLGMFGIPVALGAIALVTITPSAAVGRVSTRAVLVACGAGVTIAAQLIMLDAAPHDSGLAPLIIGRAVSSALAVAVLLAVRPKSTGTRPPIGVAAAAGCLDSLANLFFLLAARAGMLSVSAVIVSLYPAATVLLAAVVLKERISRNQWIGLAAAAVGVVLLAVP